MLRAALIFLTLFVIVVSLTAAVFYFGLTKGEFNRRLFSPAKQVFKTYSDSVAKSSSSNNFQPNSIPDSPAISQRNEYNIQIQEARNNFYTGNYDATRTSAEKSLGLGVTNEEKAVSHYWIGLGYYRQGNNIKALEHENLSISLYPSFSGPYVTVASIYMDKGDFRQALLLAQKAQSLDPQNPWAYNAQAIALFELGQTAESFKMFEKAIQLAPDSYIFKDNLTRAKGILQNKQK